MRVRRQNEYQQRPGGREETFQSRSNRRDKLSLLNIPTATNEGDRAYALFHHYLRYHCGVYVGLPGSVDGASTSMEPLLGINVVYHQFHEDAGHTAGSLSNSLLETLFVTYLYIGESANLIYTKELPSQRPLWQLLRLVSIDNQHSAKHVQFSQTIQVSTHVHAASFQDEWPGTGVLSSEILVALSRREQDSL